MFVSAAPGFVFPAARKLRVVLLLSAGLKQTNSHMGIHFSCVTQPFLLRLNAKCVFPTETILASPGAAKAGPSPSFCFSPKLPSQKMATSVRLEVQRHMTLIGESTSEAFIWLNATFSVSGVFAQSAITWPSRLCAQRAAWYEEYSPITDSMR